jgi:hypothetical protein
MHFMSIYQAMRDPRGDFEGVAGGPKWSLQAASGNDERSAERKISKGKPSLKAKECTR